MNIHNSLKKIVREREIEKKRRIKSIIALAAVLFIGIFIGNIFTQNDFSITGLVTGNLPDVGDSNWGTILNNYLLQEHTSTGAHRNVTVEGDLNVSGIIRSDNWTNVSITGSQVSDDGTYRTLNNLTFVGDGNFTGNLSIGDKITFRLGEVIDNLVDGYLRVTGSLNVTNDINVVGEINSTGLNVEGNVNITGNLSVGESIEASNLRTFDLIRNDAPSASTTSSTFVTLESSSSTNFNGRPTLFLLSISNYVTTTAGTETEFGINFDGGTNTTIMQNFVNPTLTHTPASSWVILTPSAGNHIVNIVWKRTAGSGTPSMDTNDHIHLTAIEL